MADGKQRHDFIAGAATGIQSVSATSNGGFSFTTDSGSIVVHPEPAVAWIKASAPTVVVGTAAAYVAGTDSAASSEQARVMVTEAGHAAGQVVDLINGAVGTVFGALGGLATGGDINTSMPQTFGWTWDTSAQTAVLLVCAGLGAWVGLTSMRRLRR